MGHKLIHMLAAGFLMAVVLLIANPATAGAAVHGNPNGPDGNPYAVAITGPGGGCAYTYKAAPAAGEPAPGSSARGGSPGYVDNGSHGTAC
jgi:hypothetical protein